MLHHQTTTDAPPRADIGPMGPTDHAGSARERAEYLELARRWGNSAECAERVGKGHCERVAEVACALAMADGIAGAELFWFRIGALLHDVGKLMVPADVLGKAGPLTPAEWRLVRQHPAEGVEMISAIDFPWDVSPIVAAHHERWDGAGYPYGLAGDEIPRTARIVCIADVYDALTSERSYKPALPHREAMVVMRADRGRQFDPDLFSVFERVAQENAQHWNQGARATHRVM